MYLFLAAASEPSSSCYAGTGGCFLVLACARATVMDRVVCDALIPAGASGKGRSMGCLPAWGQATGQDSSPGVVRQFIFRDPTRFRPRPPSYDASTRGKGNRRWHRETPPLLPAKTSVVMPWPCKGRPGGHPSVAMINCISSQPIVCLTFDVAKLQSLGHGVPGGDVCSSVSRSTGTHLPVWYKFCPSTD